MIKAIPTTYKGYRMRSRLEGRWATWFDAVGLHWEYEKEGFSINGKAYLPDFWIEEWNAFVEIKPDVVVDETIYIELSHQYRVMMIQGNPWPGEYVVSLFVRGKKSILGQFRGRRFKNLKAAYSAARSARFGEKAYARQ